MRRRLLLSRGSFWRKVSCGLERASPQGGAHEAPRAETTLLARAVLSVSASAGGVREGRVCALQKDHPNPTDTRREPGAPRNWSGASPQYS
ncbi:unnamed protein product [Rangifer tarandus platyrhynchus]|uniref:Uncharacterized protein n=1 Tax=Rangifer tarandus platyrhynchus TaxID=3082113 RepID=A0ABN8ZC82_RANTA|nr:unnamed protein product [Rangifer tarandus platyrhynchus]CAI9688797.1 unnamed protein product [Rangifer tarandus platyrhynchus]